ncbi:MAG: FAD-dependent oxidoreductase [Flavobacteriaceae bacterium]|nr:FAD-dependent oxidoreductase [Flavobacteriaceae bacterium]
MSEIKLYGVNWCPDCQRAKAYLVQNNIDFNFIDVDLDNKATALVEKINNGKRIIPTLVIEGQSYTNPDNKKLATILGINKQGRIKLFGADWCPDCRRTKTYLQNNSINFQFVDVDKVPEATALVEKINKGKRIIPTILIGDKPYTNPDNALLKDLLNLDMATKKEIYDVIIIGAGAAGLTAAIYAQRDKKRCLILEKSIIGGNASLTKKIENYPGFTEVSGSELMDRMALQAKTYGAKIETGVSVQDIDKRNNLFTLKTNMGGYFAKSIVIATGATYRTLNVSGEKDLIGSGIHFCATCDGAFYRDREVLIIGGGNSALEEGISLASFTKKVTIIHRKENFSASETYIEKLKEISNIKVLMNKKTNAFIADKKELFVGVQVTDNITQKTEVIAADGAFIFIGLTPNTAFLNNIVTLSESGHINTNGFGETSVGGIFAAGDCRKGAIAQVASATGEGVMASYGIKAYLTS